MFRFQGRVFLKRGVWFVWEPAWDLFRPIDAFSWNGKYAIDDLSYTKDPFSELFGFGTPEMKTLSEKLTEEYLAGIEDAPVIKEACIGVPVWARDRWVVMATEHIPLWRSHLTTIQSRARTCRRHPRGKKFTKRKLLSDKRCASI